MQEEYIEILIQSLKKKLDTLQKIQEMNKEQKLLLADENLTPEEFEKNVQKKGRLVEQLEMLDQGFDEVYQRVRGELSDHKEAHKPQIAVLQEQIRQITALSSDIQAQEKRNYELAVKKFDSVRKQIREVKASHKAVNQYYQNMRRINLVDPQFMDKKK